MILFVSRFCATIHVGHSFSAGSDDDVDPGCSDQVVPNFLEGNLLDHLGPYHGIFIGTIFCTP